MSSLEWLDAHLPELLARLPPKRDLSVLEVALFCLVTHLEFRGVLSTAPYRRLNEFAVRFGERRSAKRTDYAFDRQ